MKYPNDYAISIRTGFIALVTGLITHFSGVLDLLTDWGIDVHPDALAISTWVGLSVAVHHVWQKLETVPHVGTFLSKLVSLWTASQGPQINPEPPSAFAVQPEAIRVFTDMVHKDLKDINQRIDTLTGQPLGDGT